MSDRIATVENRWDILYRDYPEIYDEFAAVPYKPPVLQLLREQFHLDGKTILDIGSGSGKSTFELASFAHQVTGVEPETAMIELAREKLSELDLKNVSFLEGSAQKIPVPDKSFDVITAVTTVFYPVNETLPPFVEEAHRVVRDGGLVLRVNIPPQWYGGELNDVICDPSEDLVELDQLLMEYGFDHEDVETVQDYGTIDKIISTYGFIFGSKAIEYLRDHNKTTILWRNRVRFKTIRHSD